MESKTFTEKVYKIATHIPRGKVTTYGALAKMAGNQRAARAVGMCMSHNKDFAVVPCHRVVAADGSLTGYSAGKGIPTKKAKLQKEGVIFKGNKVDLTASLWKA